jgi:hypothetical protein
MPRNRIQDGTASLGSASHGNLICAGPIFKSACTKPSRIVIHTDHQGYAVHNEYFEDESLLEGSAYVAEVNGGFTSYFTNGDYCRDDFGRAYQLWIERLNRQHAIVGHISQEEKQLPAAA